MAYRRPGVTVTQEFAGLVPALASFSLPCVAVGPAFQLVDDDALGTYTGSLQTYAYASMLGGAVVDLEEMAEDEPFPATKKPLEVTLKDCVLEIVSEVSTGECVDTTFTDATASAFASVLAGDLLTVTDEGSTNVGTWTVKEKVDDNTLLLTSPFVDDEAGVTYHIRREYGTVELERVASLPGNGYTADETGITLPAALQVTVGSTEFDVVSASVEASYRAARGDFAAEVREFSRIADIEAAFGVGQVTPANPLAYALQKMLENTVTAVNGLGLEVDFMEDESLAFTRALDALEMGEMYAIAVLTQNPAVATAYKSHAVGLSAPDAKKERVVLFNSRLKTTSVLSEEKTTSTSLSGSRNVVTNKTTGEVDSANAGELTDVTADVFLNVQPGDTLTIASGANVGSYEVTSVPDANTVIVDGVLLGSSTASGVNYYIQRQDGLEADGVTFYDRNASFISDGVAQGHLLSIKEGSLKGLYQVATVVSEKKLVLSEAVAGVFAVTSGLVYEVIRDLTKSEQAALVAGMSSSFGSRRFIHVWPDVLKAPVGQEIVDLPGFYGTLPVAALTSGLPTQQGLTNLSVSGFLGLEHSSRYFTDEQLNTIADGGTMILAQEGPQQPLYIRHQLTTDRSSIKFQEYSVTKNVDFVAKFIRNSFKNFVGQYNIVDTTLDELKTTSKANLVFLSETTRIPKFGAVVRRGKLLSIQEAADQIDTVRIRHSFDMPIPLNNVDITIEV